MPAFHTLLLTLALSADGLDDREADAKIDFVREVRPILERHCYECHSETDHQSDLRLDVKDAALRGGELYGPIVVPGKPDESPLIQFVSDEEADLLMPPDGPGLSADEIAILQAWVKEGAIWPDGIDTATLTDKTDHWSFRPMADRIVPIVQDTAWPRNPIDQFVLARLEQAGLQPAPEADRAVWLRRVSLDLIGLPPTPDEVRAFQQDNRPDAYERVVDRLLNSPRHGERWAQHWLDVVRYADTHGFEVNTERPHAWHYRDYVIAALNADTPYDQFIREQIAGDLYGQDTATGFLVTASVLLPGQIGKDEPSMRLARQDSLDEIVVNIGQSFLGLTVGCARCHNHKFDPVSQLDYYSMQAFVAGVVYSDREWITPEIERRRARIPQLREQLEKIADDIDAFEPLALAGGTRASLNSSRNVDRFQPQPAKRIRFTVLATNRLEPCIDELEIFDTSGQNVALASRGATVSSSGDNVSPNRHELRLINDGRYGNSSSWMSNEDGKGWVIVELPEATEINRVVWGRDREQKFADRLAIDYRIEVDDGAGNWQTVSDASDRGEYVNEASTPPAPNANHLSKEEAAALAASIAQKQRLEEQIQSASDAALIFAGVFREPDKIRLLRRGDPEQPQQPVVPAVPAAFGSLALDEDAPEDARRRALADWIASPDNRLTARVMANRIWQNHFRYGLVDTPNDFGRNGTDPTHPALLDWLALEFVRQGWSSKAMHRMIVLSATYRQSGQYDAVAAAQDSDGRLLWRYPPRRLEGEALRDSMLAVSGNLNCEMNGRGFDLFDKRGGLTGFKPIESFTSAGMRRMIYAHKVRRERDAVFGAFDCPDGGQSAGRRRESTTPIQALNLLNSQFTLDQAEAFARRVEREAGSDIGSQIRRAYKLAVGRDPSAAEIADALPAVREHGIGLLCRVLFNSNEFVFFP